MVMAMAKNLYELKDFKEVKSVYLTETLSKEDLEEGLEPISEFCHVCITKHAWERMNSYENRFCEYEWVENLILSKSTEILNLPMNEDFILLSKDSKLAVVGVLNLINGELSIIIKTVIRKIFIDKDGNEIEKKVRFKEGSNLI